MRAHWCWRWEKPDFFGSLTSIFSSLFHLFAGFKPKEIFNPVGPPSLSHPKGTGWLTPYCRLRRGRSPKGWVSPTNWEETVPTFFWSLVGRLEWPLWSLLLCAYILFSYYSRSFPPRTSAERFPWSTRSFGKGKGRGKGKGKPSIKSILSPTSLYEAKVFHIFPTPFHPIVSQNLACCRKASDSDRFPWRKGIIEEVQRTQKGEECPIGRTIKAYSESRRLCPIYYCGSYACHSARDTVIV